MSIGKHTAFAFYIFCVAFGMFMSHEAWAQQSDVRFQVENSEQSVIEPVLPPKLEKKAPDLMGTESEIFKSLSLEIQKEVLDEVQSVFDNCQGNYMYSRLHDCRCVSVFFMDQRLREGPEKHRNFIIDDVAKVCPNTPELAGLVYGRCTANISYQRLKNTDEYCSCVANQAARLYKKRPIPKHSYVAVLSAESHILCKDVRRADKSKKK